MSSNSNAAQPIRALSFYCGSGGLDLGFVTAGVSVVWAADADPLAIETYKKNLGEHAVVAELPGAEPDFEGPIDLVIGGPPCQGFSVMGKMDPSDERSQHVFHLFDYIEAIKPRGFVIENVRALACSPRWQSVRTMMEQRAASLGYNAKIFVLNAADFGVPQARERMFMIGLRDRCPTKPAAPSRVKRRTVRETLGNLPEIGRRGNSTICTAKVVPAKNPVLRPSPYRGSLLFNGSGRPLELGGVARTLPASMGGNATPIVDELELRGGSESWIVSYHESLLSGSEAATEAPDSLRRITVEEAAALQSFPKSWVFFGGPSAQYRQIGNAVPPRLAFYVAKTMVRDLARNEPV